jgi:hypothetical protein
MFKTYDEFDVHATYAEHPEEMRRPEAWLFTPLHTRRPPSEFDESE